MQNEPQKKSQNSANRQDKGFYLSLGIGIVILGICSVFGVYGLINNGNQGELDNSQPDTINGLQANDNYDDILTNDDLPPVSSANTMPQKDETAPVVEIETPAENTAVVPTTTEKPKEPKAPIFMKPVEGKIIKAYSPNDLIFNKTMEDYRTHKGIDIFCELNDKVRVLTDGTVSDIIKDPYWGTIVKVSHSNGLMSIYSNLLENVPVKVGQTLKAGDVVGGVGATALLEFAEDPHLHFEVLSNGKSVNPEDYFKK